MGPDHAHDAIGHGILALKDDFLLDPLPVFQLRQAHFDLVGVLRGLASLLLRLGVRKSHAVRAALAEVIGSVCSREIPLR
jgi:hypothetical protein